MTGPRQRLIEHWMGIRRATEMPAAQEDHEFHTSVSTHLQQWCGARKLVEANVIIVAISIWQLVFDEPPTPQGHGCGSGAPRSSPSVGSNSGPTTTTTTTTTTITTTATTATRELIFPRKVAAMGSEEWAHSHFKPLALIPNAQTQTLNPNREPNGLQIVCIPDVSLLDRKRCSKKKGTLNPNRLCPRALKPYGWQADPNSGDATTSAPKRFWGRFGVQGT